MRVIGNFPLFDVVVVIRWFDDGPEQAAVELPPDVHDDHRTEADDHGGGQCSREILAVENRFHDVMALDHELEAEDARGDQASCPPDHERPAERQHQRGRDADLDDDPVIRIGQPGHHVPGHGPELVQLVDSEEELFSDVEGDHGGCQQEEP